MNAINLGTSQCLVISPLNLVKEFQEYQHEYLNLIIFQSYHLWIIFKITIRSPFDHHSITIRSPLISPLYIIISFSSNMFPICSLNVVFAVLPPLTSYFCCLKSHHEITMKNPWFHRKLIDVWCLDPHWWAETVLVKKKNSPGSEDSLHKTWFNTDVVWGFEGPLISSWTWGFRTKIRQA